MFGLRGLLSMQEVVNPFIDFIRTILEPFGMGNYAGLQAEIANFHEVLRKPKT
jgi:hypothetical protein